MTLSKYRSITLIEFLILFVLLLTPIFTFQEFMAYLTLDQREFISTSKTFTSPFIKMIKDLFFISIIFISSLLILQSSKINRNLIYFFGIILLFILLPAYYYYSNIWVYLSGIRWLIPLFMAASLFGHIDENLLKKMGTIIFYLFILHFTMQVIQFFFSYGYYGLNSIGLSERNPGMFYIPTTGAIFTIIVLFFSKYYMPENQKKNISYGKIIAPLIPISILLTASGTGVGIYIIFLIVYHMRKNIMPFLPIILLIATVLLLLLLNIFPGRYGLVEYSLGPRLIHFKEALLYASYIPEYFGYGTITAELIRNKFDLDFVMARTDSFYTSIIVNLGLINSVILLIVILAQFILLNKSRDKEKLLFLIMFALISVTGSITESYPANLIFAVFLAYYIAPKKINNRTSDELK